MAQGKLVYKDRIGRVRSSVFEHGNGQGDVWYNTEVAAYSMEGDEWKRVPYKDYELPVASKMLDMAYAWIFAHKQMPRPKEEGAVARTTER